jgi:hypothetical protein
MALTSSGEIKMSQINTELGRSSTAAISLDTAENGGYAAINTASSSYPSSANPARMSEWYSYDHNASSGSPEFAIFGDVGFRTGDFEGACGATEPDTLTLYFNIGTGSGQACPTSGITVYLDENGTTPFPGGNLWWKSTLCNSSYFILDNGFIEGTSSCSR